MGRRWLYWDPSGIDTISFETSLLFGIGFILPFWSFSASSRREFMDRPIGEIREIEVVHQDTRKNVRSSFEVAKAALEECRQTGLDISCMDTFLEVMESNACVHVGELEELYKEVKSIKDYQKDNFEGLKQFLFTLKGQLFETLRRGNKKLDHRLDQMEEVLCDLKEEFEKQNKQQDPETPWEGRSLMEDDSVVQDETTIAQNQE